MPRAIRTSFLPAMLSLMVLVTTSGASVSAGEAMTTSGDSGREQAAIQQWAKRSFSAKDQDKTGEQATDDLTGCRLGGALPFSFTYDGKPSAQLLGQWKRTVTEAPLAGGRRRSTTVWKDPQTGLEIECDATVFSDFPAVEWLLRLKNTSDKDTPIIENIQPLDVKIGLQEKESVVLHHSKGSSAQADDFSQVDTPLLAGSVNSVKSPGNLPYFNLEWQSGGLVGAIGWTGTWQLNANRGNDRELSLQAGQQLTHLKLLPRESIRTPRILLLHWQGADRIRGHNLFRRLLIGQYLPRARGEVVTPPLAQLMWFVLNTGNDTTERTELDVISKMPSMGLEAYWLDAGWFEGGWQEGVGNWFPKKTHFPNGLQPLGDAAHKAGLKFIVWFEPQRARPNTLVAKEHPEWLLSYKGCVEGSGFSQGGYLFDLGNPKARQWMTDFLSKRITDWRIDVYRQDCNLHPFLYWRENDAADRQGITEIRNIEGLYAMWDDLLKRHPGLVIDDANPRTTPPDLEVLMRCSGCWTTSEDFDSLMSKQPQLAGMCLYVPLHSTCLMWGADPYSVRSVARMGTCVAFDTRTPGFRAEQMKQASEEIKSLRPLYLGDYYPLIEPTLDEKRWCAWQFDRPDLGEGFALFFRRRANPDATQQTSLRGLDPKGKYEVTFAESYDVQERRTMTGEDLTRLQVNISTAPGSLLVRYSKAK